MRNRGGFTLVEIMVGIVLFSVVMLGLAGLQLVQSLQSTRQSVRVRAGAMLSSRTEGWQSVPYASLPVGTSGSCALDSTSAPGTLRFFKCDTVITSGANQKAISVNVYAPVNQRPGAVLAIPGDSNLAALQFVRLNTRVLRTVASTTPF